MVEGVITLLSILFAGILGGIGLNASRKKENHLRASVIEQDRIAQVITDLTGKVTLLQTQLEAALRDLTAMKLVNDTLANQNQDNLSKINHLNDLLVSLQEQFNAKEKAEREARAALAEALNEKQALARERDLIKARHQGALEAIRNLPVRIVNGVDGAAMITTEANPVLALTAIDAAIRQPEAGESQQPVAGREE